MCKKLVTKLINLLSFLRRIDIGFTHTLKGIILYLVIAFAAPLFLMNNSNKVFVGVYLLFSLSSLIVLGLIVMVQNKKETSIEIQTKRVCFRGILILSIILMGVAVFTR